MGTGGTPAGACGRRRSRRAVACTVLLALGAPARAQERDAGQVATRHVATQAGQEVLVRNYASWTATCTPRGEPVVTIDVPPLHGSVAVRPGVATIREHVGGDACVGRRVPGTSVWYRPAPGYRGTDQFAMSIAMVHVLRDRVVVEVR